MTTAQAADYLGVHRDTVCRLLADGRLRYFKIGRSVRIDAADLDAYVERCAVEPWRLVSSRRVRRYDVTAHAGVAQW